MYQQSARLSAVQSPIIPVVAELIRDHPGTVSLGQGVVNYTPPEQAYSAMQAGMAVAANHKYQHVQGIAPLLECIEAKLAAENDTRLAGREIVVTAGANMGFLNVVLGLADPGDEFILLRPYFFNQEMAVSMCGCRAVVVDTDTDFQIRLDLIEAAIGPRTRAVVTVSPNNPTGAVYREADLRAVNELCRRRGLYHVSDEAYEYFVHGKARHFSPASLPDSAEHTITLYSLSKAYGFASWRIGYTVLPAHLLAAVKKIQDTNLICPPVVSQYAALGAMQAGRAWCAPHIAALSATRLRVLEMLAGLDDAITVPPADGAFYLWLKVRAGMDPMTLTERLIREHQVAVIPGTTFGADDGCQIRISYGALDADSVTEGVGRLVSGLRAILGRSHESA